VTPFKSVNIIQLTRFVLRCIHWVGCVTCTVHVW